MAAKKRSSKSQLSLKIKDERVPKLIGIVLIFLAAYLTVAFTSYLFTWESDMDKDNNFSWTLLFNPEITVDNLFGRLGAVLSLSLIHI